MPLNLERPGKRAGVEEELDLEELGLEEEEGEELEGLEEGEFAFTEDEAVQMLESLGYTIAPPEGAEEELPGEGESADIPADIIGSI